MSARFATTVVGVSGVASVPPDPAVPGGRIGSLRHGISRRTFGQFMAFGVNGLCTAAVYSAVVWTLIVLSRRTFPLDVVIAYVVSTVVNYLGSRVIFHQGTTLRGHMVRYLALVAANLAVAAGIAALLDANHAPDAVGAYLPPVITAIPTFLLMKRWVFRAASPGQPMDEVGLRATSA